MSLILGIDTGGTYTDGVIVDASTREILYKSKALTTKQDLTAGIIQCLENLTFSEFDKVKLVSLSTTLATNAIVEGKGGRVGLITIGSVPRGKLPTEYHTVIKGKFDIKGKMKEELNDSELLSAIESFRGNVDSIAVSGYASVRNPSHELIVKRHIQRLLGIPVVCAHELTSTLGFYERTVTSVLNARLIPIIQELMKAIKKVMHSNGIEAPIMIVKGDGSLMLEEMAAERPVETIMSGPAASIIGGLYLTGETDALIMDMGGTTTDIANITQGLVKINRDGAKVGGWHTHVQAAEICTFGLGGDSHIRVDNNGKLIIGPQKSVPFCIAGTKWPELIEELSRIHRLVNSELYNTVDMEYYSFVKRSVNKTYVRIEEMILQLLQERPLTKHHLAEVLGLGFEELPIDLMIERDEIARISLTPTDILHAEGSYLEWDNKASALAVDITAKKMGLSALATIKKIKAEIRTRLYMACIQSASEFESRSTGAMGETTIQYLAQKAFEDDDEKLLSVQFHLSKPIVALGAPVTEWFSEMGERMNTKILIPLNSEVANAVGAAVGQIMESIEILIRPDNIVNQYIVYMPCGCESFDTLEQAKERGIFSARKVAVERAEKAGTNSFEVIESHEDIYTENYLSNIKTYVETRIKAIAVGKPSWKMR